MANKFVNDLLVQVSDSEAMSVHEDRLSRLIEDTLLKLQDDQMLSDDELEYVAAAQKGEAAEEKELFRRKKDK